MAGSNGWLPVGFDNDPEDIFERPSFYATRLPSDGWAAYACRNTTWRRLRKKALLGEDGKQPKIAPSLCAYHGAARWLKGSVDNEESTSPAIFQRALDSLTRYDAKVRAYSC